MTNVSIITILTKDKIKILLTCRYKSSFMRLLIVFTISSIIGLLFALNIHLIEDSIKPHTDAKLEKIPNEDYFQQRLYPESTFDYKSYIKNMTNASKEMQTRSSQGTWKNEGPGNMGGRVNNIAIHPNDEQIMYLGFARGGVFKTTNGGNDWESIFNEFTYLSISHIEIDQNNPNIIYLGTGDENISHYPGIGNGVYKSEDAGNTWTSLGLAETGIISKVKVSRNNPNILYASAMGIPFQKNEDRGVYKSDDGGANWQQILFVNDSTGIIDLLVDPNDDNIVYAAGWNRIRNNSISTIDGPDAKIWRSLDGGINWEILGNGLPEGRSIRIGLEMFESNSRILFASYSRNIDEWDCSGNQFYGLYKSSDGGDSWNEVPTITNGMPCDIQGGFAWYFGQVRVNPLDEDDISILGVNYYRTTDGGQNWFQQNSFSVHVDFHELVYYNNSIYVGNDGGANRLNPSGQWEDIENISANQIYRVATNPHDSEFYYAGLQDNGTVFGNEGLSDSWERILGGDGFQPAFHALDPSIFFAEYQRGNIHLITENNSEDFTEDLPGTRNWNMPYILSPHIPDLVITGSDQIYTRMIGDNEWVAISDNLTDVEDNTGNNYQHDISTLDQSPLNVNYLYAGTSDGWVWRTLNYGITWENIIGDLPRRYVSDIKASPSLENTVYLTISGYKYNEYIPHVYRSDNNGDDWVSISSNLPDLAANDIYILPDGTDQVLFVALESGVYVSQNAGESWERMGDNLPVIQCLDLDYSLENNELIVGTYGRGLLSFDLSQLGIDQPTSIDVLHAPVVNIYPTITTDVINIEIESNDAYRQSILLFDMNGRMIEQQTLVDGRVTLSGFPSGIYLVNFEYNGKNFSEKVVKI